eukprot:scaffold239671_cov92-Cyclotella_meneghiniana.AAC.1
MNYYFKQPPPTTQPSPPPYPLLVRSAFTTDAARKLNVLGHNGDALGVDSTQVRVLKQFNQVCFRRFLKTKNTARLES